MYYFNLKPNINAKYVALFSFSIYAARHKTNFFLTSVGKCATPVLDPFRHITVNI